VHREPLKATAPIRFNQGRLAKGATNKMANDVLADLTSTRAAFLEAIASPHAVAETVIQNLKAYVALLLGLIKAQPAIGSNVAEEASASMNATATTTTTTTTASSSATSASIPADAAKNPKAPAPSATGRMKNAITFKWTDNITKTTVEQNDAQYELLCILLEGALWLMRHTVQVGPTISVDEDAMKDYFRCLKIAAGILKHINDVQRPLFAYHPNTDFDERIIASMVSQTLAEAQEVTLERARLKNHNPELIAAIAADTRDRFTQSYEDIKSVSDSIWYAAKVKAYLSFKIKFYNAYAHTYHAKQLFSEEKCGDSIASFRAAEADIAACIKLGKKYQQLPSKQPSFDPSDTELFVTLVKFHKLAADKAAHENGFIYTQRIPEAVPELPPAKSLVEIEPFVLPPVAEKWNGATFDESKIPVKGQDISADKASSDDAHVKPLEQKEVEGSFCVVA